MDDVATLVTATITKSGYDVIQLRVDARRTIRVWVDRDPPAHAPSHGAPLPLAAPVVGVGDLSAINRHINDALESAGLDPGGWQVEVFSPGVDRLLCRPKDFARFAGQQVTVRLRQKRNDRRQYKGRLIGPCDDGQVEIEADGQRHRFKHATEIEEMRLVPVVQFATRGERAQKKEQDRARKRRGAGAPHAAPDRKERKRRHRRSDEARASDDPAASDDLQVSDDLRASDDVRASDDDLRPVDPPAQDDRAGESADDRRQRGEWSGDASPG